MIQLIIKINKKEGFKMNIYDELGKLDKITKNNIAQIKNHTATSLGRTISVLDKLTFNVGILLSLTVLKAGLRVASSLVRMRVSCIFFPLTAILTATRLTMIF